MAQFYDDREDEMIPLVHQLEVMPDLDSKYAHTMAQYGEYQEALEMFLIQASEKHVPLPADLVDSVRKIADDLIPASGVTVAETRPLIVA